MGLFRKLFGTDKRKEKPYVDGGMHLLAKLVQSLRLDDWPNYLLNYTAAEQEAIVKQLNEFQQIANEEVGGQALFHPEVVEPIGRAQAAQALHHLARAGWIFSDDSELPEDWKALVSTYLKAWAGGLDPMCLLEMADLLIRAGHKTEARDALEVVLLFPTYAHEFYGGHDASHLVHRIVSDAQSALQNL